MTDTEAGLLILLFAFLVFLAGALLGVAVACDRIAKAMDDAIRKDEAKAEAARPEAEHD